MARASARISLSVPGVAASSTPLAGLDAVMHGMGGPKEQGQQQQQQPQSRCSGAADSGRSKSERAHRGTAGTFNGRRPPKDAAKLKLFLAKKEVYLQKQKEARQQRQERRQGEQKKPTQMQEQYQAFMRAALQEDNSPSAFTEAMKQHFAMTKRPAASSSAIQRTPRKKVSKEEAALTPGKDVAPPSRSASSSTKK